jgi:hypothetical protein
VGGAGGVEGLGLNGGGGDGGGGEGLLDTKQITLYGPRVSEVRSELKTAFPNESAQQPPGTVSECITPL